MKNKEKQLIRNNYKTILNTSINLSPENKNNKMYGLDLFRHFLIKENRRNLKNKQEDITEDILPNYSSIRGKIIEKTKNIKSYYDIDNSIFKEMQSKNTYILKMFRRGFFQRFLGPRGLVTEKNRDLIHFYESLGLKIGLKTQIYAGSLDYYDYLNSNNQYFERLKETRKRRLKIGQNFVVADTRAEKLHELYLRSQKEKEYKKRNETEKNKLNKTKSKLSNNSIINNSNLKIKSYRTKEKSNITSIDSKILKNTINHVNTVNVSDKDVNQKININNEVIITNLNIFKSKKKSKSLGKYYNEKHLDLSSPDIKPNLIDYHNSNRSKTKSLCLPKKNNCFKKFLTQNKNNSNKKKKIVILLDTNKTLSSKFSKTSGNIESIVQTKELLKNKLDNLDESYDFKNKMFNCNKTFTNNYKSSSYKKHERAKTFIENEFYDIENQFDNEFLKIDQNAENLVEPYLSVKNRKKNDNRQKNKLSLPLNLYQRLCFDRGRGMPISEFLKNFVKENNAKINKIDIDMVRKKFHKNWKRMNGLGYSLDNAKKTYKNS